MTEVERVIKSLQADILPDDAYLDEWDRGYQACAKWVLSRLDSKESK